MATNQSLLTIRLQHQLLTKNVIDLQSNTELIYGLGFRVLGFRLALLLSQMCTTTPLSSQNGFSHDRELVLPVAEVGVPPRTPEPHG
jgi:hypothetical protein